MLSGIKYPRFVRKWIRQAEEELLRNRELIGNEKAPIEDLVIPAYLRLSHKGRLTELGELVRDLQAYKESWFEVLDQYKAAFNRLSSSDANTLEHWIDLHFLATSYFEYGDMRGLLMSEPFYQTRKAISEQLLTLAREASIRAENGSKDDFLLLQRYLRETWHESPYPYYPGNYTEFVDQFVESPVLNDYRVRAMDVLEQADPSNSLNFLRLVVESYGGSESILIKPDEITTEDAYYFGWGINRARFRRVLNRFQQLSKGNDT